MYWRMVAAIFLAVGAAWWFSRKPAAPASVPVALATTASAAADSTEDTEPDEDVAEPVMAAPSDAPMPPSAPAAATADSVPAEAEAEHHHTLDILQEGQRMAAATGVTVAAVSVTSKLPPAAPMAMTLRAGGCTLLLNARLPLGEGLVLTGLTHYHQRQLTFTLAHELGHCYMLTRAVQRDPAFLPSLSPPGKSYTFEQYAAMATRYSEYPDLNRWNEEWADTFAAWTLARTYGREFAIAVTAERHDLRKRQERFGDVLTSNIYGGHGSLAEEAIFSIQSPLEIANLVKIGRLNTR